MAVMSSRPLLLQLLLLLQMIVVLTAAASSSSSSSDLAVSSSASSSALTTSDTSQAVCTVKGRVFTQRKWYGYLVHKAFHQTYAKIQYQITYPVKECCTNLLIYYDDQVKELKSSMTCEERTKVLPPDNNQVIPLQTTNDSNGCTFWNETGEAFYVCRGERIFRSRLSRTWFFALSRCDRSGPLNLNYVFNITGYYGECEDDPLAPSSGWNSYVGHLDSDRHSSSNKDTYKYLSISLGIVAGLALILAAVFFGLWFLGLHNAAKGKGSSVTSSQATMTQDDIFYVNPSLSDREQQEYSQSGSENYYEVIPERRSYESINAGLANGGPHLRQLRSLHGTLGHHPHAHAMGHPHNHGHPGHPHGIHHPHAHGPLNHGNLHHTVGRPTQVKELGQNMRGVTYMFEDYPPPPYQPPKLMQAGVGKSPHNNPNSSGGQVMPSGASSSIAGSLGGPHHTLTLPTNRQRPNFVHHAYHASLSNAPPSMGYDGNASSGAGMMLGVGGGGINTSGTLGNPPSLLMSPQSSSLGNSYHTDTIPINTSCSGNGISSNNAGQNLGTFGISSNNSVSGGINAMSLANHSGNAMANHTGNTHQILGGILSGHTASSANSVIPGSNGNTISSMGVAMTSASSAANAPSLTSTSDQCETSA